MGRIELTDAAGAQRNLDVRANIDTAASTAAPGSSGPELARTWPGWQGVGSDWLAVKDFAAADGGCGRPSGATPDPQRACALTPARISVSVPPEAGAPLVVRGLSLIDTRTGAHTSVTLSPRGDRRRIYSGDVKIYERTTAPGRAWLVHDAVAVPDAGAALAALRDDTLDPRQTAVLEDAGQASGAEGQSSNVTGQGRTASSEPGQAASVGQAASGDNVEVVSFAPEQAILQVRTEQPGYLVLADANYPGWSATVDGQPAPVITANLLFRAVGIPAGEHEVVFRYRPATWTAGVALSLVALAALAAVLAASSWPRRGRRPDRPLRA